MDNKILGNEYRTTMVYIESYENQILSGYMTNPFFTEPFTFKSTMQFLFKLESLLDEMNYPQHFNAKREFIHTAYQSVPSKNERSDKIIGTFSIKIIFRQNASWQGNVIWLEGDKDESFRSTLELLLLLNSALSPTTDK